MKKNKKRRCKSLLCRFHFHLNVSRCRTVGRTLGCDRRMAQETLKEQKKRLQTNEKYQYQLHVGAISLASLALGPHAPRWAELETVFPANVG